MDPSLQDIREELDEHLDAINQNTAEVTAIHEVVGELDYRMEKLSERLDALQNMLALQAAGLTDRENIVLDALLSARAPVTSIVLGESLHMPADVIAQTLFCLTQKGIPVLAHTVDNQMFYVVEEGYRKSKMRKV